jgi:ketosteroid isomerase-like protein
MPEESAGEDLEQRVRLLLELGHRADWDAAMAFFAPDAVWTSVGFGFEDAEGATAIRDFWIDWYAPYEDVRIETLDVVHLGHGVVLAVFRQSGRLGDAPSRVAEEGALLYEWSNELIERVSAYLDIDEARAAARRLVAERA